MIHTLKFGTLGAARITPAALIAPAAENPDVDVVVCAARDKARAEAFAEEHDIPNVANSYEDVISSPDIDAVYVPLPITAHEEWSIRALRAGKHVLCEKSFAANAAEARAMAAVADETGLVLMDAFHYRYHPIFRRAKEIFHSGRLGDVSQVHATFTIGLDDPSDIRMNYETGGGVTMDIGCYPISWVRHLTGLEPVEVSAEAEVGPPKVDVMLKTEMTFAGGIHATTLGDMRKGQSFVATLDVRGTKGTMKVINPLVPQYGNSIELVIDAKKTNETFDTRPTYSFQMDAFLSAVRDGSSLFTDPQDAICQMELIDRCYQAAGLPLRGLLTELHTTGSNHAPFGSKISLMTYDEFNAYCRSLPGADYVNQWGGSHVWKVGGKVFAIGGWSEGTETAFVFKTSPLSFEVLKNQTGLRPAPYFASRGMKWIQNLGNEGLNDHELQAYLRASYDTVRSGLTRKKQRELNLLD